MKKNISLIVFMALLSSCANLMSNFDQNSYDSATNLKAESIALMSHANEPGILHSQEIAELQAKLNGQLAYEAGKGKSNKLSYEQWNLLVSPDKDLLGAFLKDWSNKSFTPAYVQEKSTQVSQGFDQILKLEGAKHK